MSGVGKRTTEERPAEENCWRLLENSRLPFSMALPSASQPGSTRKQRTGQRQRGRRAVPRIAFSLVCALACLPLLCSCGNRQSGAGFAGASAAASAQDQGASSSANATEAAGMDQLEAGSWQDAVTTFQGLIDDHGPSKSVLRGLGIAYMGLGRYKDAASAFEQALSLAGVIPGPVEYDINDYLGSCYYKLGRYDDAKGVYDAIIGLHPRDADAYVSRGTVEIALQDPDSMQADFSRAIDLDPKDYDRICLIFQTMDRSGYTEQGQAFLTEILNNAGDSISDYNKGRLSYYIGDYESAKSALENIKTTNYNVSVLLGQTYEALGDYNYAASVYQAYLQKDSSHPEVYNQLGLCDLRTGDYQNALDAFQSGEKLGSGDTLQSLEFNEVIAYEYLADFDKARTLMKDYVAKYPGDSDAAREYDFLKTR